MDTSKEYIEMCENAEEMQKEWVPDEGDFIWMREEDYWDCCDEERGCLYVVFGSEDDLCFDAGVSFGRSTDYESIGYVVKLSEAKRKVWLPRQDQLQEMAFEHFKRKYPAYIKGEFVGYNYNIFDVQSDFNNFYIPIYLELKGMLRTLEQLWLAFVMKEKFGIVKSG